MFIGWSKRLGGGFRVGHHWRIGGRSGGMLLAVLLIVAYGMVCR